MKFRKVLAILFWFFPYCLLIDKIAVFAVKTIENTIPDTNKEQDAHLKVELRKAKRKVKTNEERRLIRETLSGNAAQFKKSPKDFDLNKSPPRETENDIASLTIFESSSIGNLNLHNKQHEQNVNVDSAKVLEWSKGKAQDWRKKQARKQQKKDPLVRKAQYKKWRENRKTKLNNSPADLAAHRKTRSIAAKRYRQRRKAKMQSSPIQSTQEHDS